MQYIDGYKLLEVNSIINIDYWEYIINVSLANYFNTDNSTINKQDRSFLNSRKLSHKIKFVKKLVEEIETVDLPRLMDLYCYTNASNKMLDEIDSTITRVLDRV